MDIDYEDAYVIQGLLESTFLDGHQEYYHTNPSDFQSLPTSSMKGIYWGLSDSVQAKKNVNDELLQSNDLISSLKLNLANMEKAIAEKQSTIDDLKVASSYASRSGIEELERQYAAYRGSSERTISELQRELKYTTTQRVACTAQLSANCETQAILRMDNDKLQSDLNDTKDYNAGVEQRYPALMLLLANICEKYQDVVDEHTDISLTNQALHREIVLLEGIMAENEILRQEVYEMKKCLTKHNSMIAKLISESGRMDPMPLNASPIDPRRFLLESWHPEEAQLRTALADLLANIPATIRQRFAEIEEDSRDRAMRLSRDSFADGYSRGYNNGRDRTIANSTNTLSAEIDAYLDGAIQTLTDQIPTHIEKMLKSLRLARELSGLGTDILFCKEH